MHTLIALATVALTVIKKIEVFGLKFRGWRTIIGIH